MDTQGNCLEDIGDKPINSERSGDIILEWLPRHFRQKELDRDKLFYGSRMERETGDESVHD